METPVIPTADCELRGVIRFLTAKNKSATEIHQELCNVYGEKVMSRPMVSRWRKAFIDGRTTIHDEERSGRPSTCSAPNIAEDIRSVIDLDRRLTLDEILSALPPSVEISRASLHRIITEDLKLSKVCARWVPRLLSEHHKEQRVDAALQFQQFFDDEGDSLFDRIVTGDETWIHNWTPESKRKSMVWKGKDEKAPKKAKVVESAGKVMATVFWDSKGVLLIDYLPRGATINAERYCEVLKKLRRAIQNKRRGKLSKTVFLFHDNARPHAARLTQDLLEGFKWDVFGHPPYSPDLAPSDFHLFPQLKQHLSGRRFANLDDLKEEVEGWLSSLAGEWYDSGLKKLKSRYQKCIEIQGEYVEK